MEHRRLGLHGLGLRPREGIKFKGSSLRRAWEPGVIPSLLKDGLSLHEAYKIAEMWGCMVGDPDRVGNLVVTNGLYLAGDALLDLQPGFVLHSIGTSSTTPAVGDTTLTTEVARKDFASKTRATTTVTCSAFYLATECNYYIREAGVWGGSTADEDTLNSGELFSHYLQTHDNSGGSPNDLSWDYDLTLS